ncbi:MAG: response regulator [Oscillospiraceae bacterium]
MYQIMLVEDEMLVRESMAQNTNWDKFGFAPPHVFENGRQALEQLESVLPDVVITDICMPFVDGLELARNIYEKFPDTIVVVLTGFSEFSYAQKAIRYHVHDICSSSPSARRSLDQLLENPSAGAAPWDNRQALQPGRAGDEVLKDHFPGVFTVRHGVEAGGGDACRRC